jgi:hypothetical protein
MIAVMEKKCFAMPMPLDVLFFYERHVYDDDV